MAARRSHSGLCDVARRRILRHDVFLEEDLRRRHWRGALPPPLRGRVGEGGRALGIATDQQHRPPPLAPPHKGEGNRQSVWTDPTPPPPVPLPSRAWRACASVPSDSR